MRRTALSLAFLIASIVSALAWGANGAGGTVNLLNPQVQPPAGSPGLPAVDDNYAAGGNPIVQGVCAEYGHQVPCTNHYTITRASVKYCAGLDGVWNQVASGLGCLSNQGYLIEEARTNNALWSRDMTNAAWVKVTVTTALDAVGIDGTANSATTITATGALATLAQTLVLGSAAENYSVWLKRVTGSGAVNISINNFVGTTACTVTSTTVFTRCTVTATLANPVIGIQIATSGDVVIADFNQLEAGSIPTSPILTTTVSATRAADVVNSVGSLTALLNGAEGSFVSNTAASPVTANARYMSYVGNDTLISTSTTVMRMRSNGNANNADATLGSGSTSTTPTKIGASFGAGGMANTANNGTTATQATAWVAGTGANQIGGSVSTANRQIDAYFQRLSVWPLVLLSATLKAMTQ